jgi:hypothetical protein
LCAKFMAGVLSRIGAKPAEARVRRTRIKPITLNNCKFSFSEGR